MILKIISDESFEVEGYEIDNFRAIFLKKNICPLCKTLFSHKRKNFILNRPICDKCSYRFYPLQKFNKSFHDFILILDELEKSIKRIEQENQEYVNFYNASPWAEYDLISKGKAIDCVTHIKRRNKVSLDEDRYGEESFP